MPSHTMLNQILRRSPKARRQHQRTRRIRRRQVQLALSAQPDQGLQVLILEIVPSARPVHEVQRQVADAAPAPDRLVGARRAGIARGRGLPQEGAREPAASLVVRGLPWLGDG